jgi:hypothetical protein
VTFFAGAFFAGVAFFAGAFFAGVAFFAGMSIPRFCRTRG